MPRVEEGGQCAPIENVDIAPELETNILNVGTLPSRATRSSAGAAAHSGAETIQFKAARARHTSR